MSKKQKYSHLIDEANRRHKTWGWEWTVHMDKDGTYFLCGPYYREQLSHGERWGHVYPIVYSTNELYEDE